MQFPVITTNTDLVYKGTKTFWKTRVNLDLVIIYHPKSHCVEVITHHPEIGRECRLYLSSTGLLSKLDHNDLQLRLGEKKEVFIKQKKPVNNQQLLKEVLYSSMTNYIQSRIAYSISDGDEAYFVVTLQPLMGDNVIMDTNGQQTLDILIPRPSSIEDVSPVFQKKISAKDISSAMNSLKVSAEELKRATKYAELATSSVDGFKLMLAEKLKMEMEMKKLYSPVRLRWIKAINRVIVQNYCDKVRERLALAVEISSSKPSAAEGLNVVTSFSGQPQKSIRILRKSIDNSDLDKKQHSLLPDVKYSSSPTSVHQVNETMIEKTISNDSSLPAIGTSLNNKHNVSNRTNQRRLSRLNNNMGGNGIISGGLPATRMTRKSLNQDLLLQKYLPEISMKPSPRSTIMSNSPSTSFKSTHQSTEGSTKSTRVPSLLQSYNTMSQKLIAPLPITLIEQGEYIKDAMPNYRATPILSK